METSLWLFRACMDIRGSIAGLDCSKLYSLLFLGEASICSYIAEE